jgi:hypothetical protein
VEMQMEGPACFHLFTKKKLTINALAMRSMEKIGALLLLILWANMAIVKVILNDGRSLKHQFALFFFII